MKQQKPFKRVVEENESLVDSQGVEEKIKPFKRESREALNISNDEAEIEVLAESSISSLESGIDFFNTITGIIVAIFIFILFAVLADTVATISRIISSGTLAEYIYLIGLSILLFVLLLNVVSNIKQLKFIKNAEHIKNSFRHQKDNFTQEIITLTNTLLNHYEKNSDPELKNGIAIIRDELNTSQIYSEIYKDLDREMLPIIDKKAKQIIRDASMQAALSTAISPIAIFDMVLIIWRSMLLTKNIASLYGFRPGSLTTLILLKQGILNVAFAGIAEMATEVTNEMAGRSVLSKVSKSAGQGISNGVLLARLGYGIMNACRPIESDKGRGSFISSIVKSIIGSMGEDKTMDK